MKPVRKTKFLILPFFLIGLILFSACDEEKTDTHTLAKIYVDLNLAEEKFIDSEDSLFVEKERIFSKYNLTEEQFKQEIKELKTSTEVWDRFFNQANEYLDSLKAVNN